MLGDIRSNILAVALGATAFAIGCGDEDGKAQSSDPVTTADSGAGVPTDKPVVYNGTLVSILAIDATAPIPIPHQLVVLDNDTGLPVDPPITGMSAAGTGAIMLVYPRDGVYALHVKGQGDPSDSTATYDTVIINARPTDNEKLIRISSAGTASLAENSAGFKPSPERAALAGAVYWAPGGVRKGTIGCAKVYIDGATGPNLEFDQRYMASTGLPTTLDNRDKTPTSGRFFFGNLPKGSHTIKVSLDDGQTFIGPGEVKAFIPLSRAEASSPLKTLLVQMAFDVDVPTNPTPAGCTDT